MFSWSLITLFAILLVDFWIPGKYTDSKGNMALMNAMCDMSQFVVIVPVPDESSSTLAGYFFQHMLMKFGLCHLFFKTTTLHLKVILLLCVEHLNLTMIALQNVNIRGYQWNTSIAS